MARFRHMIPDEQWSKVRKLAAKMKVNPKDLLNTAAGFGINFMALAMNPPPELVKQGLEAAMGSREIQAAAEKPLEKLLAKKKRRKRVK